MVDFVLEVVWDMNLYIHRYWLHRYRLLQIVESLFVVVRMAVGATLGAVSVEVIEELVDEQLHRTPGSHMVDHIAEKCHIDLVAYLHRDQCLQVHSLVVLASLEVLVVELVVVE